MTAMTGFLLFLPLVFFAALDGFLLPEAPASNFPLLMVIAPIYIKCHEALNLHNTKFMPNPL